MDSVQIATTTLTGLVAALASLTLIQAYRLRSLLRGRRPWFCFTTAITLGMAAVYAFVLLTMAGYEGSEGVLLCYPALGGSSLCYRRWLGTMERLIPPSHHPQHPGRQGENPGENRGDNPGENHGSITNSNPPTRPLPQSREGVSSGGRLLG